MQSSAKQLANNASFQAFMNCYLREIDPGVWHSPVDWQLKTGLAFSEQESHVLELQLPHQEVTLALGVRFHSLVGRHRFTQIYQQPQNNFNWQPIDSYSTILLLINNLYGDQSKGVSEQKLELTSRTLESHQIMAHYLTEREDDERLYGDEFIDSEQSILFGHWLHPTPKSRQGMHQWQHLNYSPELGGQFQLHYFAARRDLVQQDSILNFSAEEIVQQLIKDELSESQQQRLDKDFVIIPQHPMQAQWLLHQGHIKTLIAQGHLIDLGLLGPHFTPTSSVRTLYCAELDYMLKFSIPVKITNSLRVNMRHELDAGMIVAKLLRSCCFSQQHPQFKTIDDPAYLTLDLVDHQESGFEVIIRENPFTGDNKNHVHSIAALVQEPLQAGMSSRLATLIHNLAEQQQKSLKEVSVQWFDAYLQCAIESIIRLYDSYGIALEAHQQNSLLDVRNGYPSTYYYRDNQGFYLSQTMRPKLLQREPLLLKTKELFYSDEMICDRFSYYLLVNQLFSVINRFALDDLIDELTLLKQTHEKLQQLQPQMQGVGKMLIHSILERRDIPCKGNLLTRIDDVDELQAEMEQAVYTQVPNPFYLFSQSGGSLADNDNGEMQREYA